MDTHLSEFDFRCQKLTDLEAEGVNPYPSQTGRTHTLIQVLDQAEELKTSEKEVVLAGRVQTIRVHGGSAFIDLVDETGLLQIYCQKNKLPEGKYQTLIKLIDSGDFVEFSGVLFVTKKEVLSLSASSYILLTKTLRPLPSNFHGLQNSELKFRKRYLDLIANSETKQKFLDRSLFIKNIRNFLDQSNFIEVETPVLEHVPGGADAQPFVTHHNTLDLDLYLRISLELHLKRLVVGGFENVYELGKVFRNEGMSTQHLQEFTMLEFYSAYHDYHWLMDFSEKMFKQVISETFSKLEFDIKGVQVDFSQPWARVDYYQLFFQETGLDLNKFTTIETLAPAAEKMGFKVESNYGHGRLVDQIYKKLVRPKIIQPTFLMNHPLSFSPLAKKRVENKETVERFVIVVAGSELGNAFSELNNPLDQRQRLQEQVKLRELGDNEAQRLDEDFLEALEYGMPPTAGFGAGIDRWLMFLTQSDSIRDVVLFPIMKPLTEDDL